MPRLDRTSLASRHKRPFRPTLEVLESRTVLNAGTLDPTFGTGGIVTTQLQGLDVANAVAIQPDGKIVEVGSSAIPGNSNSSEYALVRYNTDGSLDSTFGNGGKVLNNGGPGLSSVVLEPDGKILVAGLWGGGGGAVLRFDANGSLDTPFGSNGVAVVQTDAIPTLALQPDGKILVVDSFSRLNPDGSQDPTWGGKRLEIGLSPEAVALAPTGKIVIAAANDSVGCCYAAVEQFNPDGTPDPSFPITYLVYGSVPQNSPRIVSVAVQPDGHVLVARGYRTFAITRLDVNAAPDVAFGTSNNGEVDTRVDAFPASVLVQPDDRIVVVGSNSTLNLARYDPNGNLDATFGTDGTVTTSLVTGSVIAMAAALQPDGKIVVVGSVTTAGGGQEFLTARYLGDTPTGTANQRFVAQLYLDFLKRPADPAGLAYWSGLLDAGRATRAQVVSAIENSQEYHNLVVDEYYGQYLHRYADPTGLAAWGNFLSQGGTIDQVRAFLLGSSEYFAGPGAGSNDRFLSAVYHDVLGRAIDSAGAQYWGQALAGGFSRTDVAGAIIRSAEGIADEVQVLYHWLLHRSGDPAGLQAFSTDLQDGIPVEALTAAIAGSQEYAANRVG